MSSFSAYYYKNIARMIRKYRIKHGYTQEELSELLDKNSKYIGHVERCERKISNDMIIELINFFKVQPREFYNFEENFNWD